MALLQPDSWRLEQLLRQCLIRGCPKAKADRFVGSVVVALTLVLALLPMTRRYHDEFQASAQFGHVSMVAPSGSQIALSWTSAGGPIRIIIYDGDGAMLDSSSNPSGSFSFRTSTSMNGFEASSPTMASVGLNWSYTTSVL